MIKYLNEHNDRKSDDVPETVSEFFDNLEEANRKFSEVGINYRHSTAYVIDTERGINVDKLSDAKPKTRKAPPKQSSRKKPQTGAGSGAGGGA